MIDRDVAFLLTGAAIALVSSLITALVQHYLSLRADRIKREQDREEEERRGVQAQLAHHDQTLKTAVRLRSAVRTGKIPREEQLISDRPPQLTTTRWPPKPEAPGGSSARPQLPETPPVSTLTLIQELTREMEPKTEDEPDSQAESQDKPSE